MTTNSHEGNPVDVIDITPLACPRCRSVVVVEDAFCPTCGADLLEGLPRVCGNCGKAAHEQQSYCSSCGQTLADSVTEVVPVVSGQNSEEVFHDAPRERGKRTLFVSLAIVLLLGLAVAGWWFGLRSPDLQRFERATRQVSAILSDAQSTTDEVDGPEDLDAFETEIEGLVDDLGGVEIEAIRDTDNRARLTHAIDGSSTYLDELIRVASLPSADARPSQYVRVAELAREVEGAVAPLEIDVPEVSATSLTAALADLAAYRKEVLLERARITAQNEARAEQLEAVQAFSGQMDGIIGRYGDARMDLQEWINDVRAYGASLLEGYRVLNQHLELRQQLRSELAALSPPEQFATDTQSILGVMDEAIQAMDASTRAIDEYLGSFYYNSVFQTPGWQQFQTATTSISDRYSAAIATYEANKDEAVRKLSKRIPLPEVPE